MQAEDGWPYTWRCDLGPPWAEKDQCPAPTSRGDERPVPGGGVAVTENRRPSCFVPELLCCQRVGPG